jgi:hypothetical protein
LQGFNGDIAVIGIKHAIHLCPACVHQRGKTPLAQVFLLHRLGKLPGNYFLDGLRLKFSERALLLKKAI